MKETGMVSAQAVARFVDRLTREDVNLHGFELRHRGAVRAEGYWAPFQKGAQHRMYSISKSMVALAVGLLAEEGKLSLDDRLMAHFPERASADTSGQLKRLTIRDMLRMATCYRATVYRERLDHEWAAAFFTAQPTHEPGTVFAYDTGCSQVLGALCERLCGMKLLAYVQQRIFAPAGTADPTRWLEDPSGMAQGGTGLIMSLRDLGKVAQLVMDGGRGALPEGFLREATAKQIETVLQGPPEECYGYGYQFWRTRAGYAMYGMGGQLAVCCPEKGLLLCTVADTRLDPYGVQRIYDAFFEEIYDAPLVDGQDAAAEAALSQKLSVLRVGAVPHDARFAQVFHAEYAMQENPLRLKAVRFGAQHVTFVREGQEHVFAYGIGEVRESVLEGTPCLISGGWYAKDSLRVRCHFIGDAPCGMEMLLVRSGDCLTVQCSRSGDPLTENYQGFACGQAVNA